MKDNPELSRDLLPRSFLVTGDPSDPTLHEVLWTADEKVPEDVTLYTIAIDLHRYEIPRAAEIAWKRMTKKMDQSRPWFMANYKHIHSDRLPENKERTDGWKCEASADGMPSAIRVYGVMKHDSLLKFLVTLVDSAGNHTKETELWQAHHGKLEDFTITQYSLSRDGNFNRNSEIINGLLQDAVNDKIVDHSQHVKRVTKTTEWIDRGDDNPRFLASWDVTSETKALFEAAAVWGEEDSDEGVIARKAKEEAERAAAQAEREKKRAAEEAEMERLATDEEVQKVCAFIATLKDELSDTVQDLLKTRMRNAAMTNRLHSLMDKYRDSLRDNFGFPKYSAVLYDEAVEHPECKQANCGL